MGADCTTLGLVACWVGEPVSDYEEGWLGVGSGADCEVVVLGVGVADAFHASARTVFHQIASLFSKKRESERATIRKFKVTGTL